MATVGDNALPFRLGELLKDRKAGVERLAFLATASLIAVAAIVAMRSVGAKVNGVLSNVASSMG